MEKMKQAASVEGFHKLFRNDLIILMMLYVKSLKLSHHLLICIAYTL